LNQALREEQNKEQYSAISGNLRAAGQSRQADSLMNSLKGADERIAKFKKRVISLVKRSLEVMPAELVIDYGEPQANKRKMKTPEGVEVNGYQDGNLHEYVTLLYRAGDKAAAEKLGATVATDIESIINYFLKSDPDIAARNIDDFSSAVSNYMTLMGISNDAKYGNPNGALANRTAKLVQKLYQSELPAIYKELETMARDNAEVLKRGAGTYYANLYFSLKDQMEALGVANGVLEAQNTPMPQPGMPAGQQIPTEAIMPEENVPNLPPLDTTP
jgi:hypothetical protein